MLHAGGEATDAHGEALDVVADGVDIVMEGIEFFAADHVAPVAGFTIQLDMIAVYESNTLIGSES